MTGILPGIRSEVGIVDGSGNILVSIGIDLDVAKNIVALRPAHPIGMSKCLKFLPVSCSLRMVTDKAGRNTAIGKNVPSHPALYCFVIEFD